MNVVLFAWCASSVAYVDALVRLGEPPRRVVTGARCSARPVLEAACLRHGVAFEACGRVADAAFVEGLASLEPDLLFVAGCGQILGAPLLELPTLGALNFHPSRLPDYRGKEPLFWAILRGEREVGVTVHRMTAEVDAGPVLYQSAVEVPERATSASLARAVDEAGAALLPELLSQARAGALPAGELASGPGSRFPPLRAEHGLLDFGRTAVELDRLVRAASGELHAYCFFRGLRLVVLAAEPGPDSEGAAAPGAVLALDRGSVVVATAKGTLRIRSWLFLDRTCEGADLATELGLRPGGRLAANPAFSV